jgi:hypothetical protein
MSQHLTGPHITTPDHEVLQTSSSCRLVLAGTEWYVSNRVRAEGLEPRLFASCELGKSAGQRREQRFRVSQRAHTSACFRVVPQMSMQTRRPRTRSSRAAGRARPTPWQANRARFSLFAPSPVPNWSKATTEPDQGSQEEFGTHCLTDEDVFDSPRTLQGVSLQMIGTRDALTSGSWRVCRHARCVARSSVPL